MRTRMRMTTTYPPIAIQTMAATGSPGSPPVFVGSVAGFGYKRENKHRLDAILEHQASTVVIVSWSPFSVGKCSLFMVQWGCKI